MRCGLKIVPAANVAPPPPPPPPPPHPPRDHARARQPHAPLPRAKRVCVRWCGRPAEHSLVRCGHRPQEGGRGGGPFIEPCCQRTFCDALEARRDGHQSQILTIVKLCHQPIDDEKGLLAIMTNQVFRFFYIYDFFFSKMLECYVMTSSVQSPAG